MLLLSVSESTAAVAVYPLHPQAIEIYILVILIVISDTLLYQCLMHKAPTDGTPKPSRNKVNIQMISS